MKVALFDLDNTLLAGDSEHLWGSFLARRIGVDVDAHERASQHFYSEYLAGRLDIDEYMGFQFGLMAAVDSDRLSSWRDNYISEIIEPQIAPQAPALLERHRAMGHTLLIVTAASRYVAQPIADMLGVGHLLATEPEFREGRLTGGIHGTPCFREGKLTHLTAWLEDNGKTLDGGWGYSDSHNDLPLLEQVPNPVAVDPDPILASTASDRGWPIISLRSAGQHVLPVPS